MRLLLLDVSTPGPVGADSPAKDRPLVCDSHSSPHFTHCHPNEFPALHPNMCRTFVHAIAALLLPFALLLGSGAVRWTAAVPFASLSPQPDLQLVETLSKDWCVLMAAGRDISSITAADLAQFADQYCGPIPFNAIDLRSATVDGGRSAGCGH